MWGLVVPLLDLCRTFLNDWMWRWKKNKQEEIPRMLPGTVSAWPYESYPSSNYFYCVIEQFHANVLISRGSQQNKAQCGQSQWFVKLDYDLASSRWPQIGRLALKILGCLLHYPRSSVNIHNKNRLIKHFLKHESILVWSQPSCEAHRK